MKPANPSEPARVLWFEGEPRAIPVAAIVPAVEDGALRFGALPPDRCTLWIDAAPWAPLVLRDVAVGAEDLDLGTRTFSRGSAVRVKLLLREGQDAPRLSVWASPAEGRSYSRGLRSSGEKECVLRGLGAGRATVTLRVAMDDACRRTPRTVDVDGAETTETVIELHLR